jgi:hypothetical protein
MKGGQGVSVKEVILDNEKDSVLKGKTHRNGRCGTRHSHSWSRGRSETTLNSPRVELGL